ncbi:MutS protein msh5 [Entomortierella chlamydospora]|nr:MutS protein msh5 [Entomortierella chlamydospora]
MDHNSTAAQTSVSSRNRKRRRLSGTNTQSDSVIGSESVLMPESTSASTPEQDESNCAQVSTKTIDDVPESAISGNSGRGTESSSPRESASAIAATTTWSVSTCCIAKCPSSIAASSAAATHQSGTKSIASHPHPKEYQSTQLQSPQTSPALSSTSSAIRRGDSALHIQSSPAQDTKAPLRTRAKTRFPEQRPIADLDQRKDSQSHSQHPFTPVVNLSIAESDCGDSTSNGDQQSLWQQCQDSVDYQTSSGPLPGHEIFEDESHPSRYLLKQWLLRPSLDLSIIHARQQSVECFSRTENQSTVGQLASSLSHIKNIPKVLQTLPRKATISEWQAILQFGYYCLKIYSYAQEILVGDSPIIQEILQQFVVKDLVEIGTFINDVLDFDESVIEGRCVVKHNVDEELDRMRHTYHGLDSFLSDIAKEISQTIPSDFTSTINVIYFPQLGYLITVPMNPDWKTDQDFYLEGLSYQLRLQDFETTGALR